MPRTHLSSVTPEEQRAMLYRTDVLFPWLTLALWSIYRVRHLNELPYPERLGALVQCPRRVLETLVCKDRAESTRDEVMRNLTTVAAELLNVDLGVELSEQLRECFTKACANAAVPMDPQRCWPKETPVPPNDDMKDPTAIFVDVRTGEQYTFHVYAESNSYFCLRIYRPWDSTTLGPFYVPGPCDSFLDETLHNLLALSNTALSFQGLILQYESASIATKFDEAKHTSEPNYWPKRRLAYLVRKLELADDVTPDDDDYEWGDREHLFVDDLQEAEAQIKLNFRTLPKEPTH